MIKPDGSQLIFLLCTPRSGSSLATVMLQNHSQVFATQEMWFLMSLYDLKLAPYRPYGGTGIIRQLFNGMLPDSAYEQACRSFALEVYNSLLASSTAERVVDKSPRYYYLLEFLDRIFPRSRRIWLIRNPLSVIASYKKVNRHVGEGFDLKQELLQPKFNIKMADITVGLFRYMDYFSRPHPYAYKLQYEQLAARPREELARLCAFLGLHYEEGMERYGEAANPSKSDLFFSMGVGDPFVGHHSRPHTDSLQLWKDVLDTQEIDLYCRVLGAAVFHELGYSAELEEAERLTGCRYEQRPDEELLERRRRQLAEATGCRWEPAYRMRPPMAGELEADAAAPLVGSTLAVPASFAEEQSATGRPPGDTEVIRLRMMLSALEQRLEKSYVRQKQLQAQVEQMKAKINKVKAIIPFGSRLSRWASSYLGPGGWNK